MKFRNLVLGLLASNLLLAVNAANAGSGLALMKVEHGARAAGMGTAVVSLVDDVNGTVYNPAAIIGVKSFTASFGHTSYWENVRLESGYFAMNLAPRYYLHGGIRFAAVDELEARLTPSEEPLSYFDMHDVSFKSGLSYRATEKLTLGGAVGWFIEKIEGYRGSAFNVDFGAHYKVNERTYLGASAVNIGSKFNLSQTGQLNSRDIELPTTYTIGGSYRYDRYLGAVDVVYFDEEARAHLGAEAKVHELFQLRAGYVFNYDSRNISAGASFSKRNITVDYAFVPYDNELGTSHLFNLTFSL